MKKLFAALAIVLSLSVLAAAQTPLERAQVIKVMVDQLVLEMTPPAPPVVPPISTPAALTARLAGAVLGDVIQLEPSLVAPTKLTIRTGVTLEVAGLRAGRMDSYELADVDHTPNPLVTPLPKFLDGIDVAASYVTLRGLEVHKIYAATDIVNVLTGYTNITLDRNRILGDPVNGAKRCLQANGWHMVVVRNWIDDCFSPYPSYDAQAIGIFNTPGDHLYEDNFLRGGSETFLVGGADPTSEANLPSDITIRGNTITKRPEWQNQLVSVKNALELKNARRVLIERNIIEYSWGQHGQTGYLLVLTPRNQSNTAPYSTIEDVTVRDNDFAHGAGAITMSGDDDVNPSQRMARILIQANRFTDINPVLYKGDNKLILVQRGPNDITIDGNTFAGLNIGSWLYFTGNTPSVNFNITNNSIPVSKYGVFSSQGSRTWAYYVTSGALSGNVVQ